MQTITATGIATRDEKGNIEFRIVGRKPFLKMVGDYLLEQKNECRVDIRLRRNTVEKTNEQLGYYFGVVCKYAQMGFAASGWEFMNKEKTDYELRMKFFFEEFPSPEGVRKYPASLETASVIEVAELIDNAIMFCSMEFGIAIPPPDKNRHEL